VRQATWNFLQVPRFRDVGLAIGIGVAQVGLTALAARHQTPYRSLDALGVGLLAAGPAALAFRDRAPATVFVETFATTLAYALMGYPGGPIFLAMIVAFATAVTRGHRRLAWGSLPTGYLGFVWLGSLLGTQKAPPLWDALGVAAWLLVLVTVVELVHSRRAGAAQAARIRQEEARRRAGEERLRIARELHDVLAHNISLINVQSGVALHLADELPEQARAALTTINRASEETLLELRSVLDILRQSGEHAPLSPTARLDELAGLIAQTTATGLEVQTRIEGTRRPVPVAVDGAAYRIVQEALTNVRRHAGPAAKATVRLRYGDRDLTVQVEDDGGRRVADRSSVGGGNGIPGMRERATALGGQLETGPRLGGGFSVRARLPLEDSR
jgi:signal transduction histidine kinase